MDRWRGAHQLRLVSVSRWKRKKRGIRAGLVGVSVVVMIVASVYVAQASHNFSDVPTEAFYHSAVEWIVTRGITAGCAVGLYCPDAVVTRGTMAVFLQRLGQYIETLLSSPGMINVSGNPVDWTKLKNVPGGLADGVDNDNPNADTLDGIDSSGFYAAGSKVADSNLLDGNDWTAFGRVASASTTSAVLDNGIDGAFVSELSLNMSSGAESGFVLVQANIMSFTDSEANCPCQIEMRIRNVTTGTNDLPSFMHTSGLPDEEGLGMGSGSVSAVFPIAANATHQFDFQAVVDDVNGAINAWIDMWAVFIPFSGTGTKTLPPARTGPPPARGP